MLKKLKQSLLKATGAKAPKVAKEKKAKIVKQPKVPKVAKEKKAKIAKQPKVPKVAKEKKDLSDSNVAKSVEKPVIKSGKVYTSQQDPLIEITKVKKQDNEKRIYKIKDFVIYPKHGIGQIVSVEKDTIAGIDINFYKIEITKDKLILTIPTNQQSHLRPLSSINQINKAISILKGKAKVKRTMWSRRAQEYEQKINSGEIYQIAEVVRDLNKNTDMPVDQSYSERQLFEKAFERLLGEVTVVLAVTEDEAKEKLNKALGKTPEKNLVE